MFRSTFLILALSVFAVSSFGQSNSSAGQDASTGSGQAASMQAQSTPAPPTTPTQATPAPLPNAPAPAQASTPAPPQNKPLPQPKRILGLMPNYRAVSAGTHPAPPGPKESFVIATRDSFDYSAFVFVGVTSLLAEADDTHPSFGKGVGGFGDYYWHGLADKTIGNYLVVWAFPAVTHEDERYYAKGTGKILNRAVYAASRILITPNDKGHNTFNASEIFGRGVSQAISLSYYPSSTDSASKYTEKYAYALGRDALTDVFRELWPDLSYHVFHMHRTGPAG